MQEIRKISIVDTVAEDIKQSIESEKYAIGEKLPSEAEICEMTKVSRTSVREALRVLQALGYITIKPGRGSFVADFRKKQVVDKWYDFENTKFIDFMAIRMAFETVSVRLAVENASEEQIIELGNIHESFVKANVNRDLVGLIMLDELFHKKITESANNQLLNNINKEILEAFRLYRCDSFTNEGVYKNAMEPHARILKCFQMRDAPQAAIEMRTHLNITTTDMEKIHCKCK